jgi:hypothetical protein
MRRSPWRLVLGLAVAVPAAWGVSHLIPPSKMAEEDTAGLIIGFIAAVFCIFVPLPKRRKRR